MNIAKKIYCRIFQGAFRIAMPFMPYREPVCLDSLIKIPEVLSEKKVTSVLLVTDEFLSGTEGFRKLADALEAKKINSVVYNKTCPNPTVNNVEDARALYVNEQCKALMIVIPDAVEKKWAEEMAPGMRKGTGGQRNTGFNTSAYAQGYEEGKEHLRKTKSLEGDN